MNAMWVQQKFLISKIVILLLFACMTGTFLKNFFYSTVFGLFIFASIPGDVSAALLYFDPGEVDLYRGDTVTIGLRIDTDVDECINTVDAIIHYDPSIKAIDVSRGDSILNLWVENPVINEVDHTITFAGGVPGGYCGRIPGDPSLTNVVLEIVLQSPGFVIGAGDNPSARIWVDEKSQILLHDGLGTNTSVKSQEAKVNLLPTAGPENSDAWRTEVNADEELPSDFIITLSKDEVAFSGKYFITFNSLDKQSGIDHYEIMEEPIAEFNSFTWGRADAPWVVSESPYVLVDQTLNSTIRVKAIDKAGNERIGVLVPDNALRTMSHKAMAVWFIVGSATVLLIGLIGFILFRRKKKMLENLNISSE